MKEPESLVGKSTFAERTFNQAELVQFGALSGDDHPIHVEPAFARKAGLEGTIVQGSLMVGLIAGASTAFFREIGRPALSYGYDRLRFTSPVAPGEAIHVEYRITEHDEAAGKTWAEVKATASGRVVAIGVHVAKLL